MGREEVKRIVREGYAKIAKQDSSCCSPVDSCCGSTDIAQDIGKTIGYTEQELKAVPEGANLGLGCGNPVALASLRKGETVLDLGSGAGFDCFLAANKVGRNGKVIGIDMTPEMIEKARDKGRVFKEAFRVLKPGGRLMISDIVLLKELPDFIRNSIEAYIGCISGATMKNKYIGAIQLAGFKKVRIIDETSFPIECMTNDPSARAIIESLKIPSEKVKEIASSVRSIKVYGVKPNGIT